MIQSVKRPTFIIDRKKAIQNIRLMNEKALRNNVTLRPHFKTHQSVEVGNLFRAEGIEQITVSSVEMAHFFASNGWKDITIAFPLNIREIDEINELGQQILLNVLISSKVQIEALALSSIEQIGYFIKIDTGYHRAGLEMEDIKEIEKIIDYQCDKLTFKGFISHFGHTYHARGSDEIQKIYSDGIEYLEKLKETLNLEQNVILSIGDTPSCSLLDNYNGIQEIRPGNFVYYDLMQLYIGSCTENQIAMAVACPVVDKYPRRNELLIYGGAVHLSKEFVTDYKGSTSFGAIVEINNNGWGKIMPKAYVKSISQEHGLISCQSELFEKIKIGDLIGIIPVHSCLVADLLKDDTILIN